MRSNSSPWSTAAAACRPPPSRSSSRFATGRRDGQRRHERPGRGVRPGPQHIPADRVGKIVLLSDGNPARRRPGGGQAGGRADLDRAAARPGAGGLRLGGDRPAARPPGRAVLRRRDRPIDARGRRHDRNSVRRARAIDAAQARAARREPIPLRRWCPRGPAAELHRPDREVARTRSPRTTRPRAWCWSGRRRGCCSVESQPVLAAQLAAALKERERRRSRSAPAGRTCRARLDELRRYELVILSNVPATSLPPERMEAVRSYVRDFGGGLIAVGGDQAFTAGGYHGTRAGRGPAGRLRSADGRSRSPAWPWCWCWTFPAR